MENYTTINEIKKAVDEGKTVFADTESYIVIKDNKEQYLIKCLLNNWYCGLHGLEGTTSENKLNANKFYSL